MLIETNDNHVFPLKEVVCVSPNEMIRHGFIVSLSNGKEIHINTRASNGDVVDFSKWELMYIWSAWFIIGNTEQIIRFRNKEEEMDKLTKTMNSFLGIEDDGDE